MPEKLSLTLSMAQLGEYVAMFNALPFAVKHGVRVELIDDEHLRAVIDPIHELHRGGLQSEAVNGGVLASSFDLALGMPGLLRAQPERRTATVQLSMSFMRAVKGDRLEVNAWINRGGSALLFTEAEARDGAGVLCATGQGVVRLMDGYPDKKLY